VPYRGDETDPLEIIIAHRRAMRRAFLLGLAAMILPLHWLNPLYLVTRLAGTASASGLQSHSAAPPPPSPRKMTGTELEQQLRRSPASTGAPRDLVCAAAAGGWDYICFYRTGDTSTERRLKVGIVVDQTRIVQASLPYPAEQPLPEAPGLPLAPPIR
jgi:hypothetical protein